LIESINNILKVIQIEKIQQIKLIVAQTWKFSLFQIISEEFNKGTPRPDIMKKVMQTDLRKYGKEINLILENIYKSAKILPAILLDQDEELAFYEAIKETLENKFSASIQIMKEEDAVSDKKAGRAIPGKPGITIE